MKSNQNSHVQHVCSTSLEPDEESLGDQRVFDVLCDEVVDTWLSDDERHDLFDSQLPTIVDYALQLKSLKPLRGLHFSLQQQSKCQITFFLSFNYFYLKKKKKKKKIISICNQQQTNRIVIMCERFWEVSVII